MRLTFTIALLITIASQLPAQIIVSGGQDRSIVIPGKGRQTPRVSAIAPPPVSPVAFPEGATPKAVKPAVKPPAPVRYRETRYLISEPWCPHCPAAKRSFLQRGYSASNIINSATARRMGHQWSGSVPHEFTINERVQALPKPAVVKRRTQVQPARVQWNGRSYDPRTYRRCGDPRCQMCNYITSAKVWQTTSVTLPAGQQPTPDDVVTEMLGLMDLRQSDVLADLGCGDGRILIEAAKRYGCRGIGIEIDPQRAKDARQAVENAGLTDQINIITGDATSFDPAQHGVTAITAYLFPELLAELSETISTARIAASPFHAVPGLPMTKSGNVYLYRRSS